MEETKPSNIFNNTQPSNNFFGMESSPGMASEMKANWNMTKAEAEAALEEMENEMGGENGQNGVGANQQLSYIYRNYDDLPPLPEDLDKDQLAKGIQDRFETKEWMKINEAIDQLRCINKQYPNDMNEVCKMFW